MKNTLQISNHIGSAVQQGFTFEPFHTT